MVKLGVLLQFFFEDHKASLLANQGQNGLLLPVHVAV